MALLPGAPPPLLFLQLPKTSCLRTLAVPQLPGTLQHTLLCGRTLRMAQLAEPPTTQKVCLSLTLGFPTTCQIRAHGAGAAAFVTPALTLLLPWPPATHSPTPIRTDTGTSPCPRPLSEPSRFLRVSILPWFPQGGLSSPFSSKDRFPNPGDSSPFPAVRRLYPLAA